MAYLIGILLASGACVFALLTGFDRDRAFYPTMVLVVATYYILFAVMGGETRVVLLESCVAVVFFVLSVIGFKKSLWIAVAGLAGHGVFDLLHHFFIQNHGMPLWWPAFCMSFDVMAGLFLAGSLMLGGRVGKSPRY